MTSTHSSPPSYRWQTLVSSRTAVRTLAAAAAGIIAVRLMPAWDIEIAGFLLPAIFWPAVVLPGLVFTPLFLWPWMDALATRDGAYHNILTMPGERPGRLAAGAGLVTFLTVLLVAGGNDVFAVRYDLSQPALLRTLQVLVIVLPPAVAALTYAVARRRAAR